MKIATFWLDIDQGKYKYTPDCFRALVEKFSPKKETPFTVEFVGEAYQAADVVLFDARRLFDYVFIDIEKIEKRISRMPPEKEGVLLKQCLAYVEKEKLLCDQSFSPEDDELLRNLGLLTYLPSLGVGDVTQTSEVIKEALKKAGIILFYTAGKKEVHAWSIRKGGTAVEAAGKIHSDLARGFIKADVVNCSELSNFFNMAEARSRGFMKTVDREYVVEEGDIIEIKFSV